MLHQLIRQWFALSGRLKESTAAPADGDDEYNQIVRGDYRFHRGTTPEAVVAFHPSDSVQQRVPELIERSKEGSLSAEDQSELEDYLQLEHIMIMAKARARQYTQPGK